MPHQLSVIHFKLAHAQRRLSVPDPDPEIKEEEEGAGLQKKLFCMVIFISCSRDRFGPPLRERDVFRRETSEV